MRNIDTGPKEQDSLDRYLEDNFRISRIAHGITVFERLLDGVLRYPPVCIGLEHNPEAAAEYINLPPHVIRKPARKSQSQ